jgi:hypothetical protein
MQLKDKTRGGIGGPLAAATCALLGQAVPGNGAAQELDGWKIDSSLLIYSEADGRVHDLSVNLLGRKELVEDRFLSLSLTLDTLTGASPSGAAPSRSVQTFTRPSGNDSYSIGGGTQPLDDTFHDTRTALSASWELPLARLLLLDVGGSVSDEFDYTHLGVDGKLARDFNNRNTTASFGVSIASDSINPVGGAPLPLAPMEGVGNAQSKRGDQSKDVTDILLGVTQVLNRTTLLQLNYSLSESSGYLTDPYKILSVVDPVTGDLVPGPAGSGLFRYLYESRPDSREKQSLYALLKKDFGGNVLEASFRYMTDDWGVDSNTLDVKYRWSFSGGSYLQPHLRFYSQTAADFYHTVLFAGAPLPAFATADYRLGAFDGVTIGAKYGKEMRTGEIAARLELYRQSGSPDSAARIGQLAGLDLYPDLNAFIAQVTYRFGRRK